MKKFTLALLFFIFVCCLGGCGNAGNLANNATETAKAETAAQRISAASATLDQYVSVLDGHEYSSSTKKALSKAQSALATARGHQNDDSAPWWNPFDNKKSEDYCDDLDAAITRLTTAINNDKKLQESIAKQSYSDSTKESAGIFGGAWKKYMMLFLIAIGAIIAVILALSVLRKSGKKQKVKEVVVHPQPENQPAPEVIDVEASEVREVDTTTRQANLLETSRARFERECESLGHDPEEVLSYFDGDEKKAKVYISMEVNLRNQGGDKDYKQIYEEATA